MKITCWIALVCTSFIIIGCTSTSINVDNLLSATISARGNGTGTVYRLPDVVRIHAVTLSVLCDEPNHPNLSQFVELYIDKLTSSSSARVTLVNLPTNKKVNLAVAHNYADPIVVEHDSARGERASLVLLEPIASGLGCTSIATALFENR